MSNVDNTDLNASELRPIEPTHAVAYATALTRWLGDVAFNELITDIGQARASQALLRELADRIESGRIKLPEALR